MKKIRIILVIVFLFLCTTGTVHCINLDSTYYKAGVFFGVNNNFHKVDFYELPNIPNCCGKYENTSSMNFKVSLFGELDLNDLFVLKIGLNYSRIGANIRSKEFIGYSDYNGELNPVYSIHNLDTDVDILSLNPIIAFRPLSKIAFSINLGFDTGLIINKYYHQHEKLSSDDISKDINYFDGTEYVGTSRNISSGVIPQALLYHALSFGGSYDIFQKKDIIVRTDFAYFYNLKNIVSTKYWRINSFSAGLSFVYRFNPPKTQEKLEIIDSEKDNFDDNEIVLNEIKDESEAKEATFTKLISDDNIDSIVDEKEANKNEVVNEYSCCVVIFFSSIKYKTVKQVHKSIQELNLSSKIHIREWVNPENGTKYFRIISECFSDLKKAFQLLNEVSQKINISKYKFSPVVKCY